MSSRNTRNDEATTRKQTEETPGAEKAGVEALRTNAMMAHLLDALEAGQDIGHYGRLVFAMIARHFLDEQEVLERLAMNPGIEPEQARVLLHQVQARDYNPPRPERIREWQTQQEFPICPNADDPDGCNVYRDLKFPDHIYENIQHHQEKKAEMNEIEDRAA